MKPNWNEAPSWANWWAIDAGYEDKFAKFGWYMNEPILHEKYNIWLAKDDEDFEYDYTVRHKNGPAYKEKRPPKEYQSTT